MLCIVAIVAFRNEQDYLANCLRHLAQNGIEFALIDYSSDDGSDVIARGAEFAPSLVEYRWRTFPGAFYLREQLLEKADIARSLDADWIIHLDADEIMHSYEPGESLREAIERVDRSGYDVINFDEFVFLPIECDYIRDSPYPQRIRHYYFFEPHKDRLMRARRSSLDASNVESGGHRLIGADLHVAPERFALRHYIVTNQEHARRKYTERLYAEDEVARGWHRNRIGHPPERFDFPASACLEVADPSDRKLSRKHPRKRHYWQWGLTD